MDFFHYKWVFAIRDDGGYKSGFITLVKKEIENKRYFWSGDLKL